ncbi:hypothetical protein FGO68_gene14171 [Halteria grandinella]|uniref:Uncharacterized protein n=1 Tax=Halteria grandinella TaxID=5974 RepID=A0A8J8SVT3_HALGN|nr:hypothetical protein FGO68_gene14171 [Halteria grandinella]
MRIVLKRIYNLIRKLYVSHPLLAMIPSLILHYQWPSLQQSNARRMHLNGLLNLEIAPRTIPILPHCHCHGAEGNAIVCCRGVGGVSSEDLRVWLYIAILGVEGGGWRLQEQEARNGGIEGSLHFFILNLIFMYIYIRNVF